MNLYKYIMFILIIGSKENHRLRLIINLLSNKIFTNTLVLLGNKKLELFYKNLLPNSDLFIGFNTKLIEDFKNLKQNNKLLIIDDCLYGIPWFNTKFRDYILSNPLNTTIIITLPFALPIPPIIRFKIYNVFLLEESINTNKKKIYEQYGRYFKSFKDFNSFLDDYFKSNYYVSLINDDNIFKIAFHNW